jgi:hypothetical protein
MKRWTTKRAENFTYKVTDANGNSTTGTITVNIVDDVPTAITPQTSMLANGAGLAVTGKLLDIDGNIDINYGADLSGAKVQFAPSLTGTDSGFTSGGLHIMYTVSADGKTLTGATSAGTVYAITLSPDGSLGTANDTYSVQMFGLVDGGGSKIIFNAGGYQFAGGNDPWAVFRTAADDDSRDLLFTPIAPVGDQTVNSSNTSGGIGSGQSVGAGEGLRLDFVVDAQGDPAKNNTNSDYGIAANQDHTWDSHYNDQRRPGRNQLDEWLDDQDQGVR